MAFFQSILRQLWDRYHLGIVFLVFFSTLGSIAGMEIGFGLGFISWLIFLITGSSRKFFSTQWSILIPLGALCFYILFIDFFTAPNSYHFKSNLITARFSLAFLALSYLLYRFSDFEKRFSRLFHFHFIWICSFALYQAYTGLVLTDWEITKITFSGIFRPRGFFNNTMTFSYVFAIWFTYLLAHCLLLRQWKTKYLVIGSALILGGACLIATQTRGMWIAIAAAIVTLIYLLPKAKNRNLIFLAVVLLVGSTSLLVPEIRTRISSLTDMNNTSNSMRLEIWRAHLQVSTKNIIFGHGPVLQQKLLGEEYDSSPQIYRYKKMGHAHNNFLEILSRYGLVGLSLYLWLFGSFLFMSIRAYFASTNNSSLQRIALGSIGAQVVFHVGGLTEATFFDYEDLYALVIVLALMLSATARAKD